MRKLGLSFALLAGAAAPVAAQQMWQPEIGIRAGFTRFDDPNSDSYFQSIDIPGVGGFSSVNNPSALYGIIPLNGRFALQPSFGFYNITGALPTLSAISAGVRLNVALTPNVYFAVGPNAYIFKLSGAEDTQGALEGALGYRHPMGSHFQGSVEAFYEKREKSEILPEFNAVGVRIGMGYAFGGSAATNRRATGRPTMGSDRMWTPSIGLQGGWSLVSLPDLADFTVFSLPFAGQTAAAGFIIAPGPNAFSFLLPVGARMAFEPSIDIHHTGTDATNSAVTSYQVGARMNYAFNHAAYGAIGFEYAGVSATGINDGSRVGALLAAGFRFPLAGALMGRTELDYRVFDGNDVLPSGQATSFVFGILVPVK
jgi:hypothetical protein